MLRTILKKVETGSIASLEHAMSISANEKMVGGHSITSVSAPSVDLARYYSWHKNRKDRLEAREAFDLAYQLSTKALFDVESIGRAENIKCFEEKLVPRGIAVRWVTQAKDWQKGQQIRTHGYIADSLAACNMPARKIVDTSAFCTEMCKSTLVAGHSPVRVRRCLIKPYLDRSKLREFDVFQTVLLEAC